MINVGEDLIVRTAKQALPTGKLVSAILGAWRKQLSGAERLEKQCHHCRRPDTETDRITHVGRYRFPPMLAMDCLELTANFLECLVPTDRDEVPVHFLQRLLEAIGIVYEIPHSQALDTRVAFTRDMILIRLYINNPVIPGTDNKTTLCLTDSADGFPLFHAIHATDDSWFFGPGSGHA